MESLLQDLRYGLRRLLKNPGFTLIAVLTLSLHLKRQNRVFTELAVLVNGGWPANLSSDGEPERLQGFQVSANLFRMLGVAAARGRTFLDEEDRPGNKHVVVISHDLWQRRFGGDPELVGRSILLNGALYTVIGVMPADFRFVMKTDVWTTLGFTPAQEDDSSIGLEPFARLRSGVSMEQARQELDTLMRRYINKPNPDLRTILKPLQAILMEGERQMLLIQLATAGFILLIACANVANLLLARASVRRREIAIRTALGAGRLRVMRQLLAESVMLAVLGGLCGLLLASWLIPFLVGGLYETVAAKNVHVAMLKLDGTALGFTFAVSLLTTVLFGLVPALLASKVNLNEVLKEGGRGEAQGRGQHRLRSLLVVTEVALAMLFLVGAGLMIKSFWRLANANPGFESAGVLTSKIDPSGDRYREPPQLIAFYHRLLERVSAIPGVEHAGIKNSWDRGVGVAVEEHPPVPEEQRPSVARNQVSTDYFRAMGISLRAGRFFTDRYGKGASPVVIIDEIVARRHFPDENPIGKHLRFADGLQEIVGVVGATRACCSMSARPTP